MPSDGKGYEIPSSVDPGELSCFRVYVPKDTLYLGAFWQAYQFFTTWLAWARDPLHRGKQAAAVWRAAYDKARAEYETSKGVCEMAVTGIRQNPLNPCELQAEFDGNNVWVAVADLSKCNAGNGSNLPALRFNGQVIQWYDPCSGEWKDVGPATNTGSQQPVPPTNVLPLGQMCDASANIAGYLESIVQTWCSGFVSAWGILEIASGLLAVFAAGTPGLEWMDTLLLALYEFEDKYASIAQDVKDYDIGTKLIEIIYAHILPDGTIDQSAYDQIRADLIAWHDSLTSDAGKGHVAIITNAAAIFGPVGLTRLNKSMGITGTDCSGFEWEAVFDFKYSAMGWVASPALPYKAGQYLHPSGWMTSGVNTNLSGRPNVILAIEILFASTLITSIEVVYSATLGALGEGIDALIGIFDADTPPLVSYNNLNGPVVLTPGVDQVYTFDTSATGARTKIGASLHVSDDGDDVYSNPGTATIKKITLRGTGYNPFAQ